MKLFGRNRERVEDEALDDALAVHIRRALDEQQMLSSYPTVSNDDCELHKHHQPRPTYCELHHVIPRSWQYAWHPGDPEIVTGDNQRIYIGYTDLFDERTVSLCPTGHRNVHHWLTRLMHEWEASPIEYRDMQTVAAAVARQAADKHLPLSGRELALAELAIARWRDAGGDLQGLCNRQLYGQI